MHDGLHPPAVSYRLPSHVLSRVGPFVAFGVAGGMLGLAVSLLALDADYPAKVSAVGAVLVLVVALALSYTLPTRLTIGTDGVLAAWPGRTRFIAYGEITEVGAPAQFEVIHDLGVRIAVRSGPALVLAVGAKAGLLDAKDKYGALFARLYAARRAYDAALPLDVGPLLCGGRSPSAWLAELMRLGSGANVDLRTAPITVEWIWRVVASPRTPVEARVAAAVALRVVVGDSALGALREVAAGIVAPDTRSLVEGAVEGEPVNALARLT